MPTKLFCAKLRPFRPSWPQYVQNISQKYTHNKECMWAWGTNGYSNNIRIFHFHSANEKALMIMTWIRHKVWHTQNKKSQQTCVSLMGLLADTLNCGLRMRRECREHFPPPPTSKETAGKRSRHASRHVRHARAVMHVGITYLRWRRKRFRHSQRMRTRNFTYLVRGPWDKLRSFPCVVPQMWRRLFERPLLILHITAI